MALAYFSGEFMTDQPQAKSNISAAAGGVDKADMAGKIRQGRSRFLAMAIAYSLGNFNDNFMKQAVSLLAVSHHLAALQGWISIFYTIPFLIFAAPAGWMADRFSRRTVVIGSKAMELIFLSLGAWGIVTLNWPVIIAVIFLMAFQATIFGPSLVGTIPDIYPDSFVVEANSRLKSAITAAILVGVILAGFALNTRGYVHLPAFLRSTSHAMIATPPIINHLPVRGAVVHKPTPVGVPRGQFLVAISLVCVSVCGFLISFGVPRRPAANPKAKFPWAAPLDSLRELKRIWPDRLLRSAIIADSYFWLIAVLQILVINQMGIEQFHLNDAKTSYLALAELVGVVAGSLIAGKITRHDAGLWASAPAAGALAIFLFAIGATPLLPANLRLYYALVMLGGAGIAGGIMMVPLESFFQVRPEPEHRGRVIAAAWFLGFFGILMGSLIYTPLAYLFKPTEIFLLGGICTLPVAIWMATVFVHNLPGKPSWPARGLCAVTRMVLPLRYRVKVTGIKQVAQRGGTGILFLPNHPALIDPVILTAFLHGKFAVRPLALENQINKPIIRQLTEILGVLPIADVSRLDHGAAGRAGEAIGMCIKALQRGENVLLYPAGRIMRQREETLGAVSGVHRILGELPDIRVVLVRTTGLWGSSFGWATEKAPRLENGLLNHLPALLASGLFFAPRRKVNITLVEPTDLPRQANRTTLNSYLDAFYNAKAPPARYVPYSLWEKGGIRNLPDIAISMASTTNDSDVSSATREIVMEYLQKATGIASLSEEQQLAGDLGMDSLAITDLIFWLEKEFAVAIPGVEAVNTVRDVMLAARGKLSAEAFDVRVPAPVAAWMTDHGHDRVQIPDGKTIQEVFLAQANRNPNRVIVADLQRGAKTYRDLLTTIFALQKPIAALEGNYVGILLPASVAADSVYLAALFAGKIPVMINWTAGERNVRHAMDLLGVKYILTAKVLLQRLVDQGTDLSALEHAMVPLETLAESLGRGAKITAAIKARFFPGLLLSGGGNRADGRRPHLIRMEKASPTAVVLFTSGSESLPKAVPLTDENLLTNIRDALNSFCIRADDRFLGMLPPFHSFGLTGTMLLPILSGVKVVHYPNPNEVATLAKIIATHRVSILLGTPTFLSNIMRGSRGADMSSLRLCVTGAEKCPPGVYTALRKSCAGATIIEGYGITECSPFVSVTRQEDPCPGTIGRPMPSVKCAIVDTNTDQPVEPGKPGMLLVRGPSIFPGYLNYEGPSPFVQWRGELWYKTGDLVQADSGGLLTFMGRLKRFVKIGGEMVSLPAIEEVLQKNFPTPADKGPGLAVVPTADEEHPELILFTTTPVDRTQANEAIRAAGLSGLHNVRAVRPIEQMPLLGTGKTDYRALAEMLKVN